MDKRIQPLFHELEAQGWRIQESKKGWMCYPPDKTKGPVSIHKTPSDMNWYAQAVRLLKARGFETK